MVQIRKKSFIGQIVGVILIILMFWIKDKFELTTEQAFLYLVIPLSVFGIIGSIFSYLIFDLLAYIFDDYSDYERIERLRIQLKKITTPTEKKNLIQKESKKIKFTYRDIPYLIPESKIEDDEFWISFFLENIKFSPRTESDLIDLCRFLTYFKSENSIVKLKSKLLSKGFQIGNEKHERILQSNRNRLKEKKNNYFN
jgi:hypothetical protein